MKIEKGPFAGVEVPTDQLQPVMDFNNNPRFRADGSQVQYWPTHHRTPYFLEKFSPFNGYAVTITSTMGDFTMPDRSPGTNGEVVLQPTVSFRAALLKDGHVVADASVLATIYGPKAWESGETVARGRLYDALGLSLPSGGDPDVTQNGSRPTPQNPSGASLGPDMAMKDMVVTAVATGAPAAPSKPSTAAPTPSEPLQPAATQPTAPDENVPANVPQSAPQAELLPARTAASTQPIAIDSNLIRTIETQAAARGVAVPAFATIADAKTFYKELLQGKHDPRAGAA